MNWKHLDLPIDVHPQKAKILYYSRKYNLHPLVMLNLFCNGYDDTSKIEAFLFPTMDQLHSPFLFKDMKKALKRIVKAIVNKELIMIFGDYDVDGITSTAIMYKALKRLGAEVQARLPLREEGYGLTSRSVQNFPYNTSLIITVDNGSNAHDALITAAQKGIDVIVTDHHEILDGEPQCFAFLNPKGEEETYPFKDLCGAGVALKVVQALFMILKDKNPLNNEIMEYIEYAALGTIADMVSLTDENRAICFKGLQKMNVAPCKVLKCFFSVLKIKDVSSTTIGFQIAPILNSCGRIDDPNKALEVFISEQPKHEDFKNMVNTDLLRKEMQKTQYSSLKETILQNNLNHGRIIAVHGQFHKGIAGILAARVTEEFKKPAIVIATDGTGSARSVHGTNFSMINTLTRCSRYLKRFGGHTAAAGLTISTESAHLKAFFLALQASAELEEDVEPVIRYLAEYPIEAWDKCIIDDFIALEPYGQGNPKPFFLASIKKVYQLETFGKASEHLKFTMDKKQIIGFGKANLLEEVASGHAEGLYTFGGRTLQFNLHEIRTAAPF
ncbi:single-stranded-DNA-specific exonuclease RecJ [Paenibacillus qinlingensis]|uniref:Single-stranded-DNA-specific exonuclease RecJ n=1 Tax=Paenibacillus qinlingensis TaxID=1837343 RepID=A0ABU1P4H9_9BACL|nr:single-stranded-DNA-specific exonuclease RecJ [Paenibacillus qinlingensis]MDR6553972.1 single-stranded-DNA-specific exonuclease [Paenibacillus qinlingensis]